jgi:hypothetical protein
MVAPAAAVTMFVAPGANRGRARHGLQPVARLREGGGGVHHRLLVARQVKTQPIAGTQQRFTKAGDVAMPEDAEHPADKRLILLTRAVARGPLRDQKLDDRLGDRHTAGSHDQPPCAAINASTSGHVGMKFAHP